MTLRASWQRGRRLAAVAQAARAVRRAGDDQARQAARRALAGTLADARGVPMKVGQLLSQGGEDDPYRALVEGVEPLPWRAVRGPIAERLGQPIDAVFTTLEPVAVAASLGQVHRGTLRDGREVAVKVQYPHIADAVQAELKLAGLMPGLGPVRRWGFDLAGYKKALRSNMDRELDYRHEAGQQRDFRARMQVTGLVVPEVVDALSSGTLLVQTWEQGASLREAATWPRKARLAIARTLIETLLHAFFVHGVVHGDPHAGNYRFRREEEGAGTVVLLDYGCTVEVAEPARLALLTWITSAREGRPHDPLALLGEMGFEVKKLAHIEASLTELGRILLAPFLARGGFSTDTWAVGARVAELLGELRWWFRSAGPPDLLLLLRAFHGLALQLEALDVALPWWPLLCRAVGPDWLARARAHRAATSRVAIPQTLASKLRVRVERGDRPPVAMSIPAAEADDLASVVPADVQVRLVERGADLDAIQRRVRARGFEPQTLFELESPGESIRVWLE